MFLRLETEIMATRLVSPLHIPKNDLKKVPLALMEGAIVDAPAEEVMARHSIDMEILNGKSGDHCSYDMFRNQRHVGLANLHKVLPTKSPNQTSIETFHHLQDAHFTICGEIRLENVEYNYAQFGQKSVTFPVI